MKGLVKLITIKATVKNKYNSDHIVWGLKFRQNLNLLSKSNRFSIQATFYFSPVDQIK